MFNDLFKESTQRKNHPGVKNSNINPLHDAREYYYCMFRNSDMFFGTKDPVVCIIMKDEWDKDHDISHSAYYGNTFCPFFMSSNGFDQLTPYFYDYQRGDEAAAEAVLQRLGLKYKKELDDYVEAKYK